ncbi:hypothetical protein, partial [Nostoc commune]|uniref:hypothetical protein n=1 Tax=Nostoc commune TaxID=1178 RepID=UPI001E589ECF
NPTPNPLPACEEGAKMSAILILKKNKIKFSYLNRELVSNHHFSTDNYHPMLEINRVFKYVHKK